MPAFALISFPILGLMIFAALGPVRGLIWTTVVGYLFLPEDYGFEISGLPDFDKRMAVTVALGLGVMLFHKVRSDEAPPPPVTEDKLFQRLLVCCLVILLLGPLMTILDNQGALVDAGRVRRGLGWRDLVSMTSTTAFTLIPFFLARRWLSGPEQQRQLLLAIVVMGMIYTLFVLFELRMSPQLNNWVYGYFPHSWRQHLRGGGFRPIVFLQHGLWLGFFLFMVTMSAFTLFRGTPAARRGMFLLAGGWVLVVLIMSRNLGASALAILMVPLLMLAGARIQARVAAIVAVLFLAFPLLRQAELVPVNSMVVQIEKFAPTRASSLQWRFDNEDAMLARSLERPVFGWGGWGRWRVIDDKGRDATTADGLWIIRLGEQGWVGYLGFFGFLTLPLMFLPRAYRRKGLPVITAGVSMIMAGNLLYIIPNSALNPIAWLMVGALAGYVQYRGREETTRAGQEETSDARRNVPRYTRFGPEVRDGMALAPPRR